jgi:hypothetical protein
MPIRCCGRGKSDTVHTPEDYQARDLARMAESQAKGKKYADATIKSIDRVQSFWNRYA